jgi:phage terminase large subunit
MKVDVHTEVFNPVYLPYLDCMQRTQIFYGGSASGKSVFLAQRAIFDLLRGGRNYLVARQIGRTIRGSVAMEMAKVISAWGVGGLFNVNKTDGTITCNNGYQIIFVGLDDVEKLKSITPAHGVITDVWVEEATEADERTIIQLYKRQRGGNETIPKRLTLSFNPILQIHWIYKKFFASIGWADEQAEYHSDSLSILKTTYKDNAFLTHGDIRDLENEPDKYHYEVYTLGKWGILGNVIFQNWQVRDLSEMQAQFVNHRNGLDFGFGSNPAALSVSHYDSNHKTIYIYDELYETGLTNDILALRLKEHIGAGRVVCDSAEPKSIVELRQAGVNADGARKGKDSVNYGIQWMQQQTIIIDTKCINARNEFQQYHRKEDRAGNALDEPVDAFNHFIDATRYAYEDDMSGGGWSRGPGR